MLDKIKNLFYEYYAPTPPQPLSQEESFTSLIQSAQKADHQIYSEKTLIPSITFELNASLPSTMQLLTLPYKIANNILNLIKDHLKQVSTSFEEAHYKTAAQLFNWLHAALTPIFYLAAAGVIVAQASALLVAINVLALLTSGIEICINTYNAYLAHQFLQTFDLSILTCFSQVSASLSNQELRKKLPSLIKAIEKNIDAKKIPFVLEELKKLQIQVQNPNTKFQNINPVLHLLHTSFKRQFLTHKIITLQHKFLKLTDTEKNSISTQCKHYYQTCDYPTALHKSFKLIQTTFKDKKIALARQVQPWFTLDIIQKHQGIVEKLQSPDIQKQEEGTHEAFTLFERANYNSALKKQVALTNIALFSIVIAQSALTLCAVTHPIFLALLLVGSTLLYYFNSFRINAVLNSKTYDINWKNCCPNWLVSCGNTIHDFFYNKTPSSSRVIHATNVTSYIKKYSPSNRWR